MQYKGKNILITGGLGFIGSNLAHELVKQGANVTIIDSLIPDYGGNMFNIEEIKDKVKVNIADVRDEHSMNYLVKDRDIIFNLAGTLSHTDSMINPYVDLAVNCRSQLSILESCRKNNPNVKVVFSGTRGEYGAAQTLPVTEEHPLDPIDVNGVNKIAGELYHRLYFKVYGIRTTTLRITNTFGPRHQMKHHKQGIINWFIRLALDGKKIKLYGTGEQKRDTNFVNDVVKALLLVGADDKSNGEAFNLGGYPASLKEITKMILEMTGNKEGYELVPFPEDAKRVEVGDYIADYSKINKMFGWKPEVDFKEGLKRTIEFYKKNQKHYW